MRTFEVNGYLMAYVEERERRAACHGARLLVRLPLLGTAGRPAQRLAARRGGELEALLPRALEWRGLKIFIDTVSGPGSWDSMPERSKQVTRDNAYTLIGQLKPIFGTFPTFCGGSRRRCWLPGLWGESVMSCQSINI